MLTIDRLSAGYSQKTILRDVSFSLDCGFHVLLGLNGSGKTTLFRAISGAIRPDSGTVTLSGESLTALTPGKRARLLAQVLGCHQTLSGLTGEDLAEMALYPSHGIFYRPTQAEKARILRTAEALDAAYLLERPLEQMSAGERQRIELLAAIAQDTPCLLLDEPTSALDYNRTHEFLSMAKTLADRKILLASLHDPGLALCCADRILLLRDGSIVGDFIPAETDAAAAQAYLRLLYPSIRVISCEGKPAVISRYP